VAHQQQVQQKAARASVAVAERMDPLKLGVEASQMLHDMTTGRYRSVRPLQPVGDQGRNKAPRRRAHTGCKRLYVTATKRARALLGIEAARRIVAPDRIDQELMDVANGRVTGVIWPRLRCSSLPTPCVAARLLQLAWYVYAIMPGKERLSTTVDAEVISAGRGAVEAGEAESLSAWVNCALERQAKHDQRLRALRSFVEDFEREHGAITEADIREAERRARERAIVTDSARLSDKPTR
jgi:hypothetical protein